MTNQKNKFFTLVFSCCPGAGEMYFGLYKMGVSLMGLFCSITAFAFWAGWEELLFILPVVWCYSFFHTHNLRHMTAEEFDAVEDRFFFEGYVDSKKDWQVTDKHRRIFAVLLLAVGISFLWRSVFDLMGRFFQIHSFFWQLGYSIPQIAVALIILYAAIRLLREPKEAEERETEEIEEEPAA